MNEKESVEYKFLTHKNFTSDLLSVIDLEKPLMFDTETIGLYGCIRLAQFYQDCFEKPILVEYPDIDQLIALLNKCWVVCHNASYDISTIQAQKENGCSWIPKRLSDTFFLSRLHFFEFDSFSLDKCVYYSIGYNPYEDLDSSKKEIRKKHWDSDILSDEQKKYSAFDVYYMFKVWENVKHVLDDDNYKLDLISLKNLLNMQTNGMPVDIDIVNDLHKSNDNEISSISLPINCNSYKQVREYIESDKSNDEGLAKLSAQGNLKASNVRKVRKLIKENSYLKKYVTKDNHIYGRFSPSARSGRITCKEQNLQQIPRSTKQCFGVNDKQVMVYSDFSQLELRCICSVSGDPEMEKLFRDGIDLHSYTAKRLFHTGNPTKEQRYIAKVCNFGLLYGAGVNVFLKILLTQTGIELPYREAEAICRKWKNLWPKIKLWQQKGIQDFNDNKLGSTPLGRKYKAKRMTDQLNIQIQGMGSEVAKLANHYMRLAMDSKNWLDNKNWQRNFIHDSYIFVLPNYKDLYVELSKIIADSMQEAWSEMTKECKIKDLPMPVEVYTGSNWGDIENGKNITYTHKQ